MIPMHSVVLFWTFLIFGGLTSDLQAETTALTINSAEELIGQVTHGQIRTLNQALEQINPRMWKLPAVIPNSLSNQPSTPSNPRIILASENGAFFVAFSTLSRRVQFKQLEIAQVDPKTGEPNFYLIDFNSEIPRVQTNPTFCLRCHQLRERRHLRIEGWASWPGWFGNQFEQRGSELGLAEAANLKIYIQSGPRIPRLQSMHWGGTEQQVADRLDVAASRINVVATKNASVGIIAKLKSVGKYDEFKYALAGGAEFLSSELQASYYREQNGVEKEITEGFKKLRAYLTELFIKTDGLTTDRMDAADTILAPRLALLEWVMRQAGDSLKNYSTSGSTDAYVLEDGLGGLPDELRGRIIADIEVSSGLKAPPRESLGGPNYFAERQWALNVYHKRYDVPGPRMTVFLQDAQVREPKPDCSSLLSNKSKLSVLAD